jgi:putative phosphoribosyl transferase
MLEGSFSALALFCNPCHDRPRPRPVGWRDDPWRAHRPSWSRHMWETRGDAFVRKEAAMPFRDRSNAGQKLANALKGYEGQDPVILALPRGGVPVAAEIAASLRAPLDVILVRKIGAPLQPELAMGAVVNGAVPIIVRNEDIIREAMVTEADFSRVCDLELAEIARRRRRYLGDRKPIDVKDRVAIIVDDGIATGATTRAALRATRMRKPKKLVLAVPVAASNSLRELMREADDVVCLEDYEYLGAIGLYYSDFSQTSDDEVIETLARFPSISEAGEKA